jgi:hypothetical protein
MCLGFVAGRTRVENNILNQLRHCLVAENLHCALVRWQALSRPMPGFTAKQACQLQFNAFLTPLLIV